MDGSGLLGSVWSLFFFFSYCLKEANRQEIEKEWVEAIWFSVFSGTLLRFPHRKTLQIVVQLQISPEELIEPQSGWGAKTTGVWGYTSPELSWKKEGQRDYLFLLSSGSLSPLLYTTSLRGKSNPRKPLTRFFALICKYIQIKNVLLKKKIPPQTHIPRLFSKRQSHCLLHFFQKYSLHILKRMHAYITFQITGRNGSMKSVVHFFFNLF